MLSVNKIGKTGFLIYLRFLVSAKNYINQLQLLKMRAIRK